MGIDLEHAFHCCETPSLPELASGAVLPDGVFLPQVPGSPWYEWKPRESHFE